MYNDVKNIKPIHPRRRRRRGRVWLYYAHARYYDAELGIFRSVDPLAEKYPWQSGYVYCSNNPINRIDPTGLHDYHLGEDGGITLLKETKDKTDRLFGGNSGKSIEVKDQLILSQLSITRGEDQPNQVSAQTTNSADALNVFKFVAENSVVEWSVAGFKDGTNVLNTSFSAVTVANEFFFGQKDENLSFHIHSHPGPERGASSTASGYEQYLNNFRWEGSRGGGDAFVMHHYFEAAKAANRDWPSDYPKMFVFEQATGKMYNYNHKSSSQYVGRPNNAFQMRTIIKSFKLKP